MKALLLACCCGLLLQSCSAAIKSFREEDDYDEEDDDFIPFNGQRFDKFDWLLCKALDKRVTGNVIASPLTIKFLLSMLYEGSVGETAKELEKILQLPADKEVARAKAVAIVKSLTAKDPNYEVDIGSKIYLDSSLSAKAWFKRVLANYDAFIENVPFSDYKNTALIINKWVETKTRNRIKGLIPDAESLQGTVMLLVNVVYFRGIWAYPFRTEKNFWGKFHTKSGPQDVEYMTQSHFFYHSHSEELDSQILRMPYLGKKFSMYIILPRRKDGLDHLQDTLKPDELRRSIWESEQVVVDVTIPKFRIEFTADLKNLLRQIGITNIFDKSGDLHGINKNRKTKNAFVSQVIQKAMIEVNEKGTTAASAAAVNFHTKFNGGEIVFNASHPFLFFIEDEVTGTVVFVGKFLNPREVSVHYEGEYDAPPQDQLQQTAFPVYPPYPPAPQPPPVQEYYAPRPPPYQATHYPAQPATYYPATPPPTEIDERVYPTQGMPEGPEAPTLFHPDRNPPPNYIGYENISHAENLDHGMNNYSTSRPIYHSQEITTPAPKFHHEGYASFYTTRNQDTGVKRGTTESFKQRNSWKESSKPSQAKPIATESPPLLKGRH